MNDYLEHFNHNHDALGRFSKSSSAKRIRAAKRGLNKLYKINKKENQRFVKTGSIDRSKSNRYAKKLQKKIGSEPIDNLNSKQIYAGRAYCMTFVR